MERQGERIAARPRIGEVDPASQLEFALRAEDDEQVRCPGCERVLSVKDLRDPILVALMGKLLALRGRLAEVDPGGGLV